MAVIGQSHLLRRNRVPDHISHSNTIVRIVPIEVGLCTSTAFGLLIQSKSRLLLCPSQ